MSDFTPVYADGSTPSIGDAVALEWEPGTHIGALKGVSNDPAYPAVRIHVVKDVAIQKRIAAFCMTEVGLGGPVAHKNAHLTIDAREVVKYQPLSPSSVI